MARKAIECNGPLLIMLALCVLVLPLQWLVAMVVAAMIHELGHVVALYCCGVSVRRFSVGFSGALIESSNPSIWQEMICLLAGPAAGLSALLLIRWFPRIALCALCQSAFNLLPVYPLDGGRAVRCLSECIGIGNWICMSMEYACLVVLFGAGIYAALVLRLGLMPLFLPIMVLLQRIQRKFSCKHELHWVQ